MYSSVNNSDKSTSILSLKEIVGIIVVFAFMLYLLFPKGNIDQIIGAKGKNTNLSINYLESMVLYYPDNLKLKLFLLKNYDYAGEYDKALKLVHQLLLANNNKKIEEKLYYREYQLLKYKYFQTGDKKLYQILEEKFIHYFNYTKGRRDYLFFYAEATEMDFKELKYIALRRMLKKEPQYTSYGLVESAFYMASSLKKKREAYEYLTQLLKYPEANKKLKVNALPLLLDEKDYEKVTQLATELFLNATNNDEFSHYFYIALYALVKNPHKRHNAISKLIQQYQSNKTLQSYDFQFILDNLLKVSAVTEANNFIVKTFDNNQSLFDEKALEKSIKTLLYEQRLDTALKLANYGYKTFPTQIWLDRVIQYNLWSSNMDEVLALNVLGYNKYADKKYEQYLLSMTTWHTAYQIRGKIYKQALEDGNLSAVEEIAYFYEYTGEIEKGEAYFTQKYQHRPDASILKEAIRFAYMSNHFQKGLKLYQVYIKNYNINKELHNLSISKLIALKRFKEAQIFTEELFKENLEEKQYLSLVHHEHLNDKKELEHKEVDFISIYKEYKKLNQHLWKREKTNDLASHLYAQLINLEEAFNHTSSLPYLYKRAWDKSHKPNYLFSLLSHYIETQNFKAFKALYRSLDKTIKEVLDENINFNILQANYYAKIKENKKALQIFNKALKLNPKRIASHEAYLWFLIDNQYSKKLNLEIKLLQKHPYLQKNIGFASVVGAVQLQKSDLALRWLNPLLQKSKNNLEYQVVYADILEVQDRSNAATKIRLKLYKQLNHRIQSHPKLLHNKSFARIYLNLIIRYKTPYVAKNKYFKQLKKLFTDKEWRDLKIGWYSYKKNDRAVRYFASKYQMNIPWLSLYLAMNKGDNQSKQKLLQKHKKILAFRDRVSASLDIGDRKEAHSLAYLGMKDNSRDVDIYKLYNDMINEDYPLSKLFTHYKHLSPTLSVMESQVSHRWQLFSGISSELIWKQYHYSNSQNDVNKEDVLALSLKNSHKALLWDLQIGKHQSKDDYLSSSLKLKYQYSKTQIALDVKYQNKSDLTPELQQFGLENSLKLNLQQAINKRTQIAVSYKESSFTLQDKTPIAKGQNIQLNTNYLLRAGYPDMLFSSYLSYNRYKKENTSLLLPNNYAEFGTQFTIGQARANTIHQEWQTFGTVGLAVNSLHDIGNSFAFGTSGNLKGGDILNIMFEYSKGMDAIAEPYYGFHVDYRF